MTEVLPFKGLIYNASQVEKSAVIAPPYDIITPFEQDELYRRDRFNIVRVDYGKVFPEDTPTENRYTRASAELKDWVERNILTSDASASYFLYETVYEMHGEQRVMTGLFGAVKLVELGKGVYPHEKTHSKPKEDRLNLMLHTQANTSPIFSLYNIPSGKTRAVMDRIKRLNPYIDVRDDRDIVHRCWKIDAPADIEIIREELHGIDIFIADGHHRYETALEYHRLYGGKAGFDGIMRESGYVMMLLVNIADGGITILPTHRMIKGLPENPLEILSKGFDIEEVAVSGGGILDAIRGQRQRFGMYYGGRYYVLSYKGSGPDLYPSQLKDLDVTILHESIFNDLFKIKEFGYEMKVDVSVGKVDSGEYEAAFFLNPTGVENVEAVASAGLRMPPKSTYFYPKIPTGLVINCFPPT